MWRGGIGELGNGLKNFGVRNRVGARNVFDFKLSPCSKCCFFLSNSPASEFYMPTFQNTLFHFRRRLWRWNRQGVPKRRHIKFKRGEITHKKTINILLSLLGTAVLFPGVNRPQRVFKHSPPSSDEIKNDWSYTSLPPVYLRGLNKSKSTFF